MSIAHNSIEEIQLFLEGRNNDLKYLVNVETSYEDRKAVCYIHDPNREKEVRRIEYTPFIYMKDLSKYNRSLYGGNEEKIDLLKKKHGITIEKMKTGNHPRLEDGYPYKITTTKTYQNILDFLSECGLNPWEKMYDHNDRLLKDRKGRPIFKNREFFFMPKTTEQFFISTGIRLFKGFDDYNQIHKVIFDIETTGLRWEHERIFAIGIKDNKGFETVLEVAKEDDDKAEINLIKEFFRVIDKLKPAIIAGYNSENFDFEFILKRLTDVFEIDIETIKTTLAGDKKILRKKSTVKFGNSTEHFKATKAYGYTILDIIHAVKKTMAVNTDIQKAGLKYICKFEGIAKKNRMYIDGSEGNIGRYFNQNPMFIINRENNNYIEIPDKYTSIARDLYVLTDLKNNVNEEVYGEYRKIILRGQKEFIGWLKENGNKIGKYELETGKNILRQYLLDDLWETEQVDNLYNQSSFLLAKLVPTTYSRVSTMGSAAVWNLLMTTWSYENDLAIPVPDVNQKFSGGLTRCYKKGYTKRLLKIDYASLYPMIQLTHDVFPLFDITGVIKKMLSYMTTTRNIYKKLASGDELNDSEVSLLKTIDHDGYIKYQNNSFTNEERKAFKVKQLPIKILNNSLFGALGSGFAFNWSDNTCAARITCTGRLYLRQAISFFRDFGLDPLLAVTDGINFGIPDTTTIKVTDEGVTVGATEGAIEEMWQYGGKVGVSALINKFNNEFLPKPYMSVDNDGEFDSCLNLSRINYALKIGDKIKLTGNTIKSKTMSEYIEDFIKDGFKYILSGDGQGFVEYYHDYAEKIFYKQIPLKKIASKSKVKSTIEEYLSRGVDKNGKLKGRQAHMELLIREREKMALKIFKEKYNELGDPDKTIDDYDIVQIMEIVETYMPPEPEIGTMVYYVNTGTRKSHGDVKTKKSKDEEGNTVEELEIKSQLIDVEEMEKNPDLTGEYNVDKYLDGINKRVKIFLDGFDPEIRDKILVKIKRKKIKDINGNKIEVEELIKNDFTPEQLELKNYPVDQHEESMRLEDKEVQFWNSSGYNPRNIWDGFVEHNSFDYGLIHYDIYLHALNYLSDKMEKVGKPRLKTVDDKLSKGDYVLLKSDKKTENKDHDYYYRHDFNEPIYTVGYFNGKYVEIVKQNVEVPKSEKEMIWENEMKETIAKLDNGDIIDNEYLMERFRMLEKQREEKIHYWGLFVKKYNISMKEDMDELLENSEKVRTVFYDFIEEEKEKQNDGELIDEDVD